MNSKSRSGFTLLETLLAVAIVAILITTFLAVFGPATTSIRRSISSQDADRLVSSLENELSVLRESEATGSRETAFEKAFDWIADSSSLSNAIILFNYRGDTSNIVDGEMAPYTGKNGAPGNEYLVQSAVRRLGDNDEDLESLLSAVEGRIYLVRMSQLIRDGRGYITAEPGASLVSSDGTSASDADSFDDAAIAFSADFYVLPAASFSYLNGTLASAGSDFDRVLNEPLFSRNLAVRR